MTECEAFTFPSNSPLSRVLVVLPIHTTFSKGNILTCTFSIQHFQVQLNPFISIVEKPGKVDFKWVDGANTATPPAGFESYFGNPPLYRHIDFDGMHGLENMVDKVRDLPEGMTAEDTMRALVGDEEEFYSAPAVNKAIRRLFELVDEDPEIDVSVVLTLFRNRRVLPYPAPCISAFVRISCVADGYTMAGDPGLFRRCNDGCNHAPGRTAPV